jgi:hypothetical protein
MNGLSLVPLLWETKKPAEAFSSRRARLSSAIPKLQFTAIANYGSFCDDLSKISIFNTISRRMRFLNRKLIRRKEETPPGNGPEAGCAAYRANF